MSKMIALVTYKEERYNTVHGVQVCLNCSLCRHWIVLLYF